MDTEMMFPQPERCVPQKYGSMHRLRVYPVGRLGYESSCACGWSSDLRTTKEEAHEDARQHAAGMR